MLPTICRPLESLSPVQLHLKEDCSRGSHKLAGTRVHPICVAHSQNAELGKHTQLSGSTNRATLASLAPPYKADDFSAQLGWGVPPAALLGAPAVGVTPYYAQSLWM